jgi:hypothetical protein
MESCFGCGIRSEAGHPVVAIMKYDENEPTKVEADPAKLWLAVPVCTKCHVDPAHRTVTIKGTFFAKTDATVALRLADMQNIGAPKI